MWDMKAYYSMFLGVRYRISKRANLQESTTSPRHVKTSGYQLMQSWREVLRTGDDDETCSDNFDTSLQAEYPDDEDNIKNILPTFKTLCWSMLTTELLKAVQEALPNKASTSQSVMLCWTITWLPTNMFPHRLKYWSCTPCWLLLLLERGRRDL